MMMTDVTLILCTCIRYVLQAEKKVKELQNELDDLTQRLDEAGGATQAQASWTCLHKTIYIVECLFVVCIQCLKNWLSLLIDKSFLSFKLKYS